MSVITVTELSGRVQVEFLEGGLSARLLRDYHIELVVGGKHRVIIVPKGFVTDFASSPPRLWGLFPPIGLGITEASIVHDYLYNHPGGYTRAECDEIFYQIMLALGTRKSRARIGYWGVRLGGWVAWRNYRQRNKQWLTMRF